MIQTVDFNMFRDSFTEDSKNQFSDEALRLLFNYIEKIDSHIFVWELDPTAYCNEFAEMSLTEFNDSYGYASEDGAEFPTLESAEQHIQDRGLQLVGRTTKDTLVFSKF